MKMLRSLALSLAGAFMAMAAFACEVLLRVSAIVAESLTPQKLEVELAQNVAHKVTDSSKPFSIGSGSGDSPLSFVSMLKAINSRSFSATA